MTARTKEVIKLPVAEGRRPKGPFTKLSQAQFRSIWNDAKAEVGLGADDQVVPHILRHTCASRLVQGGIDIRRVQMWLGHQTLTMTMRYAHLATNDLDGCVVVLETPRYNGGEAEIPQPSSGAAVPEMKSAPAAGKPSPTEVRKTAKC
jgi:integrase